MFRAAAPWLLCGASVQKQLEKLIPCLFAVPVPPSGIFTLLGHVSLPLSSVYAHSPALQPRRKSAAHSCSDATSSPGISVGSYDNGCTSAPTSTSTIGSASASHRHKCHQPQLIACRLKLPQTLEGPPDETTSPITQSAMCAVTPTSKANERC